MIENGSNAPDATVFTAPRQPVRLSELYARGTTVLLFYPLSFSSTCTEEMCTVAEDLSTYNELGANVYGISVDSPYVNRAFAAECGATFPILSDFNREASTAFDVLREDLGGLRGVSERVVYVIDAGGVVRYTWMGEHPGVLPPFEEIRSALRDLAVQSA